MTYADEADEIEFVLVDVTQTESISLLNGLYRQSFSDLPPQHCVDKAIAKRALKYFFETQTRDNSLDWVDGL